jgi:hypothetical protein|tara:strand:- start:834 stop:1043 length:210 start_codon:yes stop_codon:yes gene_type:complete
LFYNGFYLGSRENSYNTALFPLSSFIGDDGIKFSFGECSLIYRELRAYVFGENEPFFGMRFLIPLFKIA